MLTNIFPIQRNDAEVRLRRLPYSEQALSDLRRAHNATHSFFRCGDSIYASWMDGEDIDAGELTTVPANDEDTIIASLVRHVFFRTFRRQVPGVLPLSFSPFQFLSRKHDLARNVLPQDLQGILCFQKLIEIGIKSLKIPGEPDLAFVIDSSRRWSFRRSLAELHAEGFNLVGSEVLVIEPIPGLEDVLTPNETLIGRVKSVADARAIVETNDGDAQLPLETLILRRSRSQIQEYLTFKLGRRRTEEIMSTIRAQTREEFHAVEIEREITEYATYFSKWGYYNCYGFSFTVRSSSQISANPLPLSETTFIFNPNPGFAADSILKGLLNYGPYDSAHFTPKSPHILVVCHKANRAAFSQLLGNLINGIPESPYFKKGLKALFRLHDVSHEFVEFGGATADDYVTGIGKFLAHNTGKPVDLALIEGIEEHVPNETLQNSYYRAKALLMGSGIPVQAVKGWRARLPKAELFNIFGPLALQIYAKLGGTPWVLPASGDVDREIVVGIGSSVLRSNRYAGSTQLRVVGFTTFFSSDGRFLLSNKCNEVDYEGYFNELLETLESSMKTLAAENGWREGDTVRVIFHIFKPVKDVEALVVEELVKKFSQFVVTFAFVTISTKHPFLLFDDDPGQQRGKGYFVPLRGTHLVLDPLSCLLQLKGRKEMRSDKHGFSPPALIRIHDRSTFQDLHYIVQQVLNFTFLSWRSFFPTYLPVTLDYSRSIARMLGKLRGLPEWNPQVVNTTLRRKKWFL